MPQKNIKESKETNKTIVLLTRSLIRYFVCFDVFFVSLSFLLFVSNLLSLICVFALYMCVVVVFVFLHTFI